MLQTKHKPSLRDLVKTDALPANLGILQDSLGTILDNFYFENLLKYKSADGSKASYNLDIYFLKEIQLFQIPGTGISLILNPADTAGIVSASSFNVTFDYRLDILKLLKEFKVTNFDFSI